MIKPKCLHKIVMIDIYKIEQLKELLSFVAPDLKKSEASKTYHYPQTTWEAKT